MVTLTDSARDYLEKVGSPNVFLSVKGGGCSGFQYVWDMTKEEPTIANLKIDSISKKLKKEFKKKNIWVASSTHKNEEIFCAKAHLELKKKS